MSKVILVESEKKTLLALNNHQEFKSSYGCLNAHKGLRRGKIHLLVGTTGGGKSTLAKSWLFDFISSNKGKKVLLWLTEETEKDFKIEISKVFDKWSGDNNLHLYSEEDQKNVNRSTFKSILVEEKPDVLFIDNITTSDIYPTESKMECDKTLDLIKSAATHLNIPIVIVAHTRKDVRDDMGRQIEASDIEGSSRLGKKAEYMYILQSFREDNRITATLRIKKCRGHQISNNLFKLFYDREKNMYFGDTPLPFEEMKEIYGKRNKLTK